MIVFHMDLDNTLIYSYKWDIGKAKRRVESYQGRDLSFVTENTCKNLRAIHEKMLIVPTSTRSIEQYNRIRLPVNNISYALVCNGGILLTNGTKDDSWYQTSLAFIQESLPALELARHFLEKDIRRKFELRFIEDLFLFTKCDQPESVVRQLQEITDCNTVNIFHNKEKVFVVPVNLSKGKAVERFREYIGADQVIAAGDSEFDISMLREADIGIAPHGFAQEYAIDFRIFEMPGNRVFSDEMTEKILELYAQKTGLGVIHPNTD